MRFSVGLLLLSLLLVCGCGQMHQAPYEPTKSAQDATSDETSAREPPVPPGDAVQGERIERKIVYTAEIDLVVENFESVQAEIDALTEQFDAFVAHSNVVGSAGRPRRGEWVIRVPVDQYRQFLAAARKLGEPRAMQSDSRDVTEEYYDVEARIRNKKQEEERLLELLQTATGGLKDVLEIERELSRVREEAERMEGRLRVLEDTTSLTTVTIRVEEVKDYVPPQAVTYRTRARRAFEQSLNALIVTGQTTSLLAIALAPWAAVVLALGLPVYVASRLIKAGRKSR